MQGEGITALLTEFGRLLGAGQPPANWPGSMGQIVGAMADTTCRESLLAGFADALRSRGASRDGNSALLAALSGDSVAVCAMREQLAALFQSAQETAGDNSRDVTRRAVALALLAHADFRTVGETLLALVDPSQPVDVQARAIRALAGMHDERIAASLASAERFAAYSPVLREEVLSALLSGKQHLPGLIAAIESGAVSTGAIDSLRRRQLTEHRRSGTS